ncbi:E3 ubiquitin-protein ligase Topors [Mycena venus]|uniref:RING-type E3 ubiquitin transferase n=1 Tax=Mycena venus TaxID=2733690 RepID=A0A8H6X370_9AGAR|nr:E3 ubiquitin-protein ligase Topors [Mycena venus]
MILYFARGPADSGEKKKTLRRCEVIGIPACLECTLNQFPSTCTLDQNEVIGLEFWNQKEPEELELEEDEERCSICLQEIADRTVVPVCAHEFCFDCLIVWTEQSRRCPLCSQGIGPFLIHKIRSRYDYQKHYLNPLPTSPVPLQPLPLRQNRAPRRRPRESQWGRQERTGSDEADRLDRSIAKRKWIYEHDLYAKHVASNAYTRYRPYPSPAQFAASPDLISRTTMFLRRELQVWVNLDVEFLTTFIISIMKAIDIRSESAVKLLSEFLDLDAPYVEGGRHVNAEHFAHEVYSYVRSPYKDLFVYDSVVQYEVAPDVPPPAVEPRRRWRAEQTEAAHIQYNEPERLPPTPAATETTETLNTTGKARSIPGPIASKEEISIPASAPREESATESVVPPLAEAASRSKPPRVRNRSLFESVQAHLAVPSRKQRETMNPALHPSPGSSNAKPSADFDNEDADTGSVPSLLTRLSDPGTRQPIYKPDKGNGAAATTKTKIPVDAVSEIPIEGTEDLPQTRRSTFSAPEIMARTRARLAKLAANDPQSGKSSSLDGGVGTAQPPSPYAYLPSPLSLGSRQDGNGDISTCTENIGATSPRRARLLGRLEEEKQTAAPDSAAVRSLSFGTTAAEVALNVALDRISQAERPIAFPADMTSTSGGFTPTHENADAVEARLRRQAQLRVRLAAEKRKHASRA